MTRFSSDSMKHYQRQSSPETNSNDEALGWEGHVNVPRSPIRSKIFRNSRQLPINLAFSMVFAVGAFIGVAITLLFGCNKMKSEKI